MRINHNIAALKTANVLNKNNNAMVASTERLSSGYKINKAADDAAGMAISRKMKTQIRALEQASRNAADGVSVIQTAEGALNEVQSIGQRMRELAVQAANGTNTDDDRETIQAEIEQLKEEINRISTTTDFNTKNLLDGSIDRKSYSNTDSVTLVYLSDEVDVKDYEITVTTSPKKAELTADDTMDTTNTCPGGTLTINGLSVEIKAGATAEEAYATIRDAAEKANVLVSVVDAAGNETTPGSANSYLQFTTVEYGSTKKVSISSDSQELLNSLGLTNTTLSASGTDAKVSLDSGFSTTSTASVRGDLVTITDVNGFTMKIQIGEETAANTTAGISVLTAGPMSLQIGASEGQTMELRIPAVNTDTLGITNINLATESGATEAIDLMDAALTEISNVRAKLGAYQNRLEHAITNLDGASLNLSEALSRIEDTDMAEEMTQYTQNSVLVQAATSMLSQANELPQQVLSLLQG